MKPQIEALEAQIANIQAVLNTKDHTVEAVMDAIEAFGDAIIAAKKAASYKHYHNAAEHLKKTFICSAKALAYFAVTKDKVGYEYLNTALANLKNIVSSYHKQIAANENSAIVLTE